jgi:hypothetical protein
MLGFHLLYLKVLEVLSCGSQVRVTPNKHVAP